MPDTPPRCLDCGVPTELMTLQGHSDVRFVSEENRDGLLGKLGVKQRYSAEASVFPECGLSRLYADLDG
jgi:hypothetical protein